MRENAETFLITLKAKICNLDRYNTIPMKNYITVGIAALGLIIAAAFLGNAIKNRNKSQNTISVTGLGAKEIYFRSYYMECFFFSKSGLSATRSLQ